MIPLLKKIVPFGFRLARPNILFWTLPAMMILILFGTIAQKTIGTFTAQQEYFSSFFVLIGGILPFPGGATLLTIFFVNLLAKFLLRSEWSWAKAGTNLSHFGVILLVFGALLTALASREGYLLIPQGTSRNMVEDYHAKQMVIRKDGLPLLVVAAQDLATGQKFNIQGTKLTLTISTYCENCDLVWADGQAKLTAAKPDPQDEKNRTGISFTLSGSASHDGPYLTFDKAPQPPVFEENGHSFQIALERETQELPFSIELKKFEQKLHPGTDMAKSYSSDVIVHDTTGSWPATISMNQPLRYRGYTFYQSSFDLSDKTPATVLAVVQNRGRIFPYLASALIALGLLFHISLRLKRSLP